MPGITDIAKKVGITNVQVKGVFASIVETCKAGETVSIDGFGSIRMVDRKATTASNPKTQEKVNVPAQRVLRVKFSQTLREGLNPGLKPAKPAKPAAPAATPAPAAAPAAPKPAPAK